MINQNKKEEGNKKFQKKIYAYAHFFNRENSLHNPEKFQNTVEIKVNNKDEDEYSE